MNVHLSFYATQLDVPGTAFERNARVQSIQHLIARSRMAADGGVRWSRNLIVDRDVAHIYVIDANGVAVLFDGRVALQRFHIRIAIS